MQKNFILKIIRSLSVAVFGLLISPCILATNYTVNNTNDGHALNQLRGALESANATAGPHTINLIAGTYTLTLGQLFVGDVNSQSITINGAGIGATIINGNNSSRIIILDQNAIRTNVRFSVTGVTFMNGKTTSDTYGGGAFQGYGIGDVISFSNCSFVNNSSTSSGGIGGALSVGHGTLSVTACLFSGNTNSSTPTGGAIGYDLLPGSGQTGNLTISDCTFTNNSVTSAAGAGGAISITTGGTSNAALTFIANITRNNFVTNSAGGEGGAVYVLNGYNNGTVNINYNRFYGNTATATPARSAVSVNRTTTTTGTNNIANNWWGCNDGPSGCSDKGNSTGTYGTAVFTPYLLLKTTGGSVCTNASLTITSAFNINSVGSTIAAANLTAFAGLPISWGATVGTVSPAASSFNASGAATTTFTAGSNTGSSQISVTSDYVLPSDPVAQSTVTISASAWTGATSSAWSVATNWSCNTLPAAGTDIIIPVVGTGNYPQVDITGAVANNITINTGASLSFTGAGNILTVNGSITNNGTFSASGGKTIFAGTAAQSIPAATYQSMQVTGGSLKSLTGPVTVTGVLTLTDGYLVLGNNNLTISGSGAISGGSSTAFVAISGSGRLTQVNLGPGGRTGTIQFPVGVSGSSYNPVSMQVSGTADDFSVGVINNVYSSYNTSDNPTSSPETANAVGKTWLIKEATAGGTTAALTFQWTAADELSGFDRTACFGSHYYSGSWHAGASGAASGSNPYTQSLSGVTSFSPFGVGSIAGVLPVSLVSFAGAHRQTDNLLAWVTANDTHITQYAVERSAEGRSFNTIGFIASKRNGAAGNNNYEYTDAHAADQTFYYRLKMQNTDGTFSYSNLVLLRGNKKALVISAAPNPFVKELHVAIDALPAKSVIMISLTDAAGNTVLQKTQLSVAGTNTILLEGVGRLAQGTYFLQVKCGDVSGVVELRK